MCEPDETTRPDGLPELTEEEFRERWQNDPDFRAALREVQEKIAAMPETPELAPLQAMVREGLKKHRRHDALEAFKTKLAEIVALHGRKPEGTVAAHVQRLTALVDEAVDLALDLHEPDRSNAMKELLPLREELRAMRKG